jgi:hypothetical protein
MKLFFMHNTKYYHIYRKITLFSKRNFLELKTYHFIPFYYHFWHMVTKYNSVLISTLTNKVGILSEKLVGTFWNFFTTISYHFYDSKKSSGEKNWKNMLFFFLKLGLKWDHKFSVSSRKKISVRQFFTIHFWTFFLSIFEKLKKLSNKNLSFFLPFIYYFILLLKGTFL